MLRGCKQIVWVSPGDVPILTFIGEPAATNIFKQLKDVCSDFNDGDLFY